MEVQGICLLKKGVCSSDVFGNLSELRGVLETCYSHFTKNRCPVRTVISYTLKTVNPSNGLDNCKPNTQVTVMV